jgi:pyrroline-5-carboxylate reductase
MATALARGFVGAQQVDPTRLMAADPSEAARAAFVRETGGRVCDSNAGVLQSEVVFLAVKPAQVLSVLEEVRTQWRADQALVSIAAGITLRQLEAAVPDGVRVIRVMPNTPAMVGASATAFALGRGCSREDGAMMADLMGAVGLAVAVEEKWMDAVTGLSGSGPAYGFLVIEALSDGAVAAGLPRDLATRLAAQTLLGAARMVLDTGLHPGALKDQVTSPGGTTIEALHVLEQAGVRGALMGAVRAAADKSKRLGAG